ncbi:MAG: hypothetical protein LBR95_03280 [Azoarcus sp.]|jgi:hypothetical protein|nr:hypothetical protein [Azoarcus sp.]
MPGLYRAGSGGVGSDKTTLLDILPPCLRAIWPLVRWAGIIANQKLDNEARRAAESRA